MNSLQRESYKKLKKKPKQNKNNWEMRKAEGNLYGKEKEKVLSFLVQHNEKKKKKKKTRHSLAKKKKEII